MKNFLVFSLLFISFAAISQIQSPVSFTFEIDTIGEDIAVVALATIDEGWKTYSHYTDPDGPIPTSITIENASTKGDLIEKGVKIKGYDEMFDMTLTKYKNSVSFMQRVMDVKGESIKGYVTYMCCDDKRCLPPVDISFELSLK